jgi:hypothetical protein
VGLHRIPRSYWAFVVLSVVVPPLTMVVTGQKLEPKLGGLAIVGLILWALARGSLFAWGLSLLWNLFLLLSIAAIGASGLELSGVLLLLTAAASVGVLLSPSMRGHVGLRRRRHAALQP